MLFHSAACSPVRPEERQGKIGHPGAVLWLTGLSGAGKTTLACALERALFDLGSHVCALDGDTLRGGLNADLGFSWEDRRENVRRVAEVAGILSRTGMIVIAALISPAAQERAHARKIATMSGHAFLEIFLDTPLAICEARDPKGLYRRARAGELPDFTGIGSPYEAPIDPEVTVHTDREELARSVERIVALLRARALLPAHA